VHEARAIAAPVAVAALLATAGVAEGRVIEKGDRGKSVKRVQRALGVSADGIFGPGTRKAVKRFQRSRGLAADGVVGPATWAALRSRARKASAGGGGSSISVLQRKLGLAADGVFGPQTKAAVKSFQRHRGLTADGVVGPATWAALGERGRPVVKARGSSRSSTGATGRIARMVAGANRIARKPYRYGGGHGSFRDSGYDCSGSVSYVLHAAGLLKTPRDSSGFMSYGAPGKGRRVTIYANPGHVFMVIDGRRFDTTGRAENGTRWQPSMRSTAGYTVRHPVGL
jgi:peptidoglycan hydrolase-like protein with peptidoglycan-binding domain